jgi:molybdopterin/thiamine biosynthesis adenylyltransferase
MEPHLVVDDSLEIIPESKIRFNDAPWAKVKHDIMILGAGGIGSWVGLALSRIGHTLHIYDFDNFELINMAGQFVSNKNIDVNKAEALCDTLALFNEAETFLAYSFNEKVDENTPVLPIVFSCFDNMKARKDAFESWCKLDDKIVFIDGRLTAESYQVYVVAPHFIERYKETLFSDEEGSELPCSYKSTTHTSMMIASEMVNSFNQHVSISDAPFSIKASLILFQRDVEY